MTNKQLTHIGVMSATLHGSFVAFVLAYPSVTLLRFFQGFDPQRQGNPDTTASWVFWIVVPVVFALLGAILTALSCLAYNLSTKLLGGVRYTNHT